MRRKGGACTTAVRRAATGTGGDRRSGDIASRSIFAPFFRAAYTSSTRPVFESFYSHIALLDYLIRTQQRRRSSAEPWRLEVDDELELRRCSTGSRRFAPFKILSTSSAPETISKVRHSISPGIDKLPVWNTAGSRSLRQSRGVLAHGRRGGCSTSEHRARPDHVEKALSNSGCRASTLEAAPQCPRRELLFLSRMSP